VSNHKGSLCAGRIYISIAVCLSLSGCSVSREGDLNQMKEISEKFSTALDEGIKKDQWNGDDADPRVIASWSCVFAREMAYVAGQAPQFSPRSPDEDQARLYTKDEWHELVRSKLLRADRKVYFDEQKYNLFIENVLGKEDYARIKAIRQRWRYFEELKKDYGR